MEPNYKFTEDGMEHWVFDDGWYAFPLTWSEEQKHEFIKEANESHERYLEEGYPKDATTVRNENTETIKYKENGSEVIIKTTIKKRGK